jgi:hypothetical protein
VSYDDPIAVIGRGSRGRPPPASSCTGSHSATGTVGTTSRIEDVWLSLVKQLRAQHAPPSIWGVIHTGPAVFDEAGLACHAGTPDALGGGVAGELHQRAPVVLAT